MSAWLTALPIIGNLLDKIIPDPEQKAKAQLELLKLQQDGAFKELDAQVQLSLAQAEINKIEAAQTNPFSAGWRPAAGWVCVFGLGYEFMVRPLLPWLLTVASVPAVPPLPSLDSVLFELIFGMLGLGTMRSLERHGRVNAISKIG